MKMYLVQRLFQKKDEINLISPFTHRLKRLLETKKMDKFFHEVGIGASCIEDLKVVNYDRFFKHFSRGKRVEFY